LAIVRTRLPLDCKTALELEIQKLVLGYLLLLLPGERTYRKACYTHIAQTLARRSLI
jgi:hypothetical protein